MVVAEVNKVGDMATYGRKMGFKMASNLMRTLLTPSTSNCASNSRTLTTAAAAATATSSFVSSEVITSHTAKWMQTLRRDPPPANNEPHPHPHNRRQSLATGVQCSSEEHTPQVVNPALPCGNQDTSKKSPMELINEVPPIKVEARIVACEGAILRLGIQLSLFALIRMSQLSASIVVYAMFKTMATITTNESENKFCKDNQP
ncbi:unnamed protein product [Camellia sinensis]